MILSQIAAVSKNGIIGQNGQLPWSIPADLKYFQQKTLGRIVIMGRKTYESIGGPLPKRHNIVVTRQKGYQAEGCKVFSNMGECIAYCQGLTDQYGEEVFIIGGGDIYRITLPFIDRLYVTEIDKDFEGDAKFPTYNKAEFTEVSRESHLGDPNYSFVVYQKKS